MDEETGRETTKREAGRRETRSRRTSGWVGSQLYDARTAEQEKETGRRQQCFVERKKRKKADFSTNWLGGKQAGKERMHAHLSKLFGRQNPVSINITFLEYCLMLCPQLLYLHQSDESEPNKLAFCFC